ncbi:hypothetical protein Rsub_12900 [Raphidocelis subcapitata]|uniref:Protein kinase domain-containing protein n=1 Tax=Raphidocelis subcapitata TaxID=307507 RepID=A0A2V0PSD7_9CHLO|nr:hypothetical protein Rsub_12900 [Raphidocelis subcapitata]|eukprot:GBG00256.1 hypothetical protein Rsub_12900 [Raphidocelis subcapitata]
MPSSGASGAGRPRTREELARELQEALAARPQPAGSAAAAGTPPRSGGSSWEAPAAAATAAAAVASRQPSVEHEPVGVDRSKGGGGGVWAEGSSRAGTRWWATDAAAGPAAAPARRWPNLDVDLRRAAEVVRRHPSIIAAALAVTLALAAAGIAGVLVASAAEEGHRRDAAQGFADTAAVGFGIQLQQMLAPLLALATFIHDQPNFPALARRFDPIARELLAALPEREAVASLQLTPQGVVRSFYPLPGNEAALNHDLLRDPDRRQAALETIQRGVMTLQGPLMLKQGWLGLVPRLPIFIENVTNPNETFGAPAPPYNCSICYNPVTRRMFWGFASCVINFSSVEKGTDPRLKALTQQGYQYALYAPQPNGTRTRFAASRTPPPPPPASVSSTVYVPNSEWELRVYPARGWVPGWRGPMLATTTVAAALIGLLVGAVLVGRRQQAWLLAETRAANTALAAEKQRMDVLLARQYNLISCVLESGAMGAAANGGTLEEKTLARIEDMRRAIGVSSSAGAPDELRLVELLGEGSFGKVYKGVWRGSTVAIKTVVLPARMSGAEKRERMAVMEAAISSSMTHPCIVQTYTYAIKPLTDSSSAAPTVVELSGSQLSAPGAAPSPVPAPAPAAFEVSLVLELCDLGCLRDALDAGAFYTAANTLNYAAILDTAADVARAMAHLHRHQVVHSDLKTRNVLLKSDGGERGVVAKVADFGLAVRIDSADTHVSAVQGTLSHMGPEAQLGRVSKAGDVYSFGITLWELYTGGHAFADVPRALLGHKVAVQGLRPRFPGYAPREYRQLAEACWTADPEKRPTFDEILEILTRMRTRLGGTTTPLTPYTVPRIHSADILDAAAEAAEAASASAAARSAPSTDPGSGGEAAAASAAPSAGGILRLSSLTRSYYVGDSVDSADGSHAAGQEGAEEHGQQSPPGGGGGGGAAAAAAAAAAARRASFGGGSFVSRLEPIADGGDDEGSGASAAAAAQQRHGGAPADVEAGLTDPGGPRRGGNG